MFVGGFVPPANALHISGGETFINDLNQARPGISMSLVVFFSF